MLLKKEIPLEEKLDKLIRTHEKKTGEVIIAAIYENPKKVGFTNEREKSITVVK